MAYFDNFPYTTFFEKDSDIFVKDFVRSVDFQFDPADVPNLFEDYYLQDGDKIENIAYNFYGSTQYHWVLMVVNGIKDNINDVPQKDYVLREACAAIYGDLDGFHHYENANNPGEIVDFVFSPSYPVTNIEHMIAQNEKKRLIKILRPQYLTDFVASYMKEITA